MSRLVELSRFLLVVFFFSGISALFWSMQYGIAASKLRQLQERGVAAVGVMESRGAQRYIGIRYDVNGRVFRITGSCPKIADFYERPSLTTTVWYLPLSPEVAAIGEPCQVPVAKQRTVMFRVATFASIAGIVSLALFVAVIWVRRRFLE